MPHPQVGISACNGLESLDKAGLCTCTVWTLLLSGLSGSCIRAQPNSMPWLWQLSQLSQAACAIVDDCCAAAES